MTFTAPRIDWFAAWPITALLVAGVIGILVEAFAPRWARRPIQVTIASGGLLLSLVGVIALWSSGADRLVVNSEVFGAEGAGVVVTRTTLFLMGMIVVSAILSLLLITDRGQRGELDSFAPQAAAVPGSSYENEAYRLGLAHTEIFPLTMFAVGGMLVFASAADLLTMFVALEVFSLPLYIMCGLERRRLLSQEAALKYFLLGAFSSALFIFGVALIYGATGAVSLTNIGTVMANYDEAVGRQGLATAVPLVVVGMFLILAGLLFKVGAVPFHSWTPDVYKGAPTSITGFMAATVKMAAFGALLRVLLEAFGPASDSWSPYIIAAAVATMVVGSMVSTVQNDVKRFLAYSSIAHAGFILTALVAVPQTLEAFNRARSGVLFYLLAYGLATVAAFGMLSLVREQREDGSVGPEAPMLAQWSGLARRSPTFAAAFTVLLLSFTGIPLTVGFVAKYTVFRSAIDVGYAWVAVVGVICSAIAAYGYLRVIIAMYFSRSEASRDVTVVAAPLATAAVTMGVIAVVVLGFLPGPVLNLTQSVLAAVP